MVLKNIRWRPGVRRERIAVALRHLPEHLEVPIGILLLAEAGPGNPAGRIVDGAHPRR